MGGERLGRCEAGELSKGNELNSYIEKWRQRETERQRQTDRQTYKQTDGLRQRNILSP